MPACRAACLLPAPGGVGPPSVPCRAPFCAGPRGPSPSTVSPSGAPPRPPGAGARQRECAFKPRFHVVMSCNPCSAFRYGGFRVTAASGPGARALPRPHRARAARARAQSLQRVAHWNRRDPSTRSRPVSSRERRPCPFPGDSLDPTPPAQRRTSASLRITRT
jgi:hypothetical protein